MIPRLRGIWKRHWRLSLVAFGVLLVLVAGFGFSARNRSRITRAAYDQIEVGMTEQEVEAIIGCPPGNYTGPLFRSELSIKWIMRDTAKKECWVGPRGVIEVRFDKDGKVLGKKFAPMPGLLDGLIKGF